MIVVRLLRAFAWMNVLGAGALVVVALSDAPWALPLYLWLLGAVASAALGLGWSRRRDTRPQPVTPGPEAATAQSIGRSSSA